MKALLTIVSFSLSLSSYFTQVLTVSPTFPTVDDVVTIVFDASQGNGALLGATQVYAHTGVITSTSTSPTNWQYTKGVWGTADASVAMTALGNNKHSLSIDINLFYNFPPGTTVLDLAFVFRNASGAIVGRSQDGSDIYYPIYPNNGELFAKITSPINSILLNLGEQFTVNAESNQNATLSIYDNGILADQILNATQISSIITGQNSGDHLIELVADNGNTIKRDTLNYTVNPSINVQDAPIGTLNGLNYISDTEVILQLFAPEKENVYVIGDFNNWIPNVNYYMNKGTDNATWWIQISGLTAGQKYGYQYLIDGSLKVADPLSTLILDPNNDQSINNATYPDRLPYPTGKTSGFVTVLQLGLPTFNWQNDSFVAPEKKDLIIYELLVRDFIAAHNYNTLIDTLDYLERLGINAIELMPVNEFENNESWGYNPSFHMALDKYYGTPEDFKSFIDECHARGIAVIIDVVLNHAFGQSPMVNMYWDASTNKPAANNPWFNANCPHEPYCWGYDLNHEVQATKDYIDRINKYWIDEFHIDGYRFDYTKGFVNNANGFSQTRIDILKRMSDVIWSLKPDTYVILEHWCDNSEETQLSNYGMMLWGNLTYNYHQGNMGYPSNSDLTYGVHSSRGWNDAHLISYAESHDEERLMYETITYGNPGNTEHDVRNSLVALERAEASAVILLTTPGPKMIWQFGELGYDISIDNPCRVCNKPILWNYQQQNKRKELYQVYSAVLNLRKTNATFRTLDFQHSLNGSVKRLKLNETNMDAVVLANMAVVDQNANPSFQSTGWWYEYFTGDSLNVTDVNMSFTFKPGEYRIYTSSKLDKPEIINTASYQELEKDLFSLNLFPVPSTDFLNVTFNVIESEVLNVKVINFEGKVVKEISKINSELNNFKINISSLKSGNYLLLMETKNGFASKEFVKI